MDGAASTFPVGDEPGHHGHQVLECAALAAAVGRSFVVRRPSLAAVGRSPARARQLQALGSDSACSGCIHGC